MVSTEIARDFNQQTVLVKDFNTNKIYLVDQNRIQGINPKDTLNKAKKRIGDLSNVNTTADNPKYGNL